MVSADSTTAKLVQANTDDDDATSNKPEFFLKNGLKVEWTTDMDGEGEDAEPTGRHEVKISGTCRFEVIENVVEEDGPTKGDVIFQSALLRRPQDDLRSAINVSVKNAVSQAFVAKWNELFPPEARERAKRETISAKLDKATAKNEEMQFVMAELQAAIMEGRKPDLKKLTDRGVNPAEYGLGNL